MRGRAIMMAPPPAADKNLEVDHRAVQRKWDTALRTMRRVWFYSARPRVVLAFKASREADEAFCALRRLVLRHLRSKFVPAAS